MKEFRSFKQKKKKILHRHKTYGLEKYSAYRDVGTPYHWTWRARCLKVQSMFMSTRVSYDEEALCTSLVSPRNSPSCTHCILLRVIFHPRDCLQYRNGRSLFTNIPRCFLFVLGKPSRSVRINKEGSSRRTPFPASLRVLSSFAPPPAFSRDYAFGTEHMRLSRSSKLAETTQAAAGLIWFLTL